MGGVTSLSVTRTWAPSQLRFLHNKVSPKPFVLSFSFSLVLFLSLSLSLSHTLSLYECEYLAHVVDAAALWGARRRCPSRLYIQR